MTDRPTRPMPDLAAADIILINTSGGKDSQAIMDEVHRLATAAGVADRLIAVHCDLGRVEWADTKDLAAAHAAHYGMRFEVVSRERGDLLDQIADRRVALDAKGKFDAPAFPSSTARFCTSDQKTSQVAKLMTRLVDEFRTEHNVTRPVRIVNCLGIRAAESPARAKKEALHRDSASNGKREVTRWLPIFDWSEDEVWARIKETGVPYHWAYDLGMSRLSCAFCVFASKADLKISARHNRKLAEEYVALEELTRSRFTHALSMAEVLAEVDAEDAAGKATPIPIGRRTARRIPVSVVAA